jgi:hypothetical protein
MDIFVFFKGAKIGIFYQYASFIDNYGIKNGLRLVKSTKNQGQRIKDQGKRPDGSPETNVRRM